MAGFLSGSSAMRCLKVDDGATFSMDALREAAFETATPEMSFGFVGLGDMLDTENFEFALCDGHFAGFSFRVDERKPQKAAVKLEIDKAVKEKEELSGKKLSRKSRKELAENITKTMTAVAPFVPSVVDCIWDLEKKRLYIGSGSLNVAKTIQFHMHRAFQATVNLVQPANPFEMPGIFQSLQQGMKFVDKYQVIALGSATLAAEIPDEEGKAIVSVKDDSGMISHALDAQMEITRISLAACLLGAHLIETPFTFTLDQTLNVSGLSFPKPEKKKKADEATFIVNANICQAVGDIIENIGNGNLMWVEAK